MPPKKKEVVEAKPVLGRFKSNLKVHPAAVVFRVAVVHAASRSPCQLIGTILVPQVGIVGLPNVGKSTLFNCLTHLSIPAENFPFCTIDPNAVSS